MGVCVCLFRYRCVKCVNVHVCQSCFLTDRQTRKHKRHHSVLEFCTQVSEEKTRTGNTKQVTTARWTVICQPSVSDSPPGESLCPP